MRITVEYMAQLKRAAGLAAEAVDVPGKCSLADLLVRLAHEHSEAFRALVLDGQGTLQPALLLFVGDEQVRADRPLCDGERITVLTPMAGG